MQCSRTTPLPSHYQMVIKWQLCSSLYPNQSLTFDLCALVPNTPFMSRMFIIDSLWLVQKSNNISPLRFWSGKPFLPITVLQVFPSFPIWALNFHRSMLKSGGDFISRTWSTFSQKPECSELLFVSEISFLRLRLWSNENKKLQLHGFQTGKYSITHLRLISCGNSRVGERPLLIKRFGTGAHILYGFKADYLPFPLVSLSRIWSITNSLSHACFPAGSTLYPILHLTGSEPTRWIHRFRLSFTRLHE